MGVRQTAGGSGGGVRVDVEGFRQDKCFKCDRYAGRKNIKLKFGKTYCLATHEEVYKCFRIGNYLKAKED